MGDWYYIGHYGQLGPLTLDQMEELVEGGVIARDTYVWRNGMGEWASAGDVVELAETFRASAPFAPPPPPPMPNRSTERPPAYAPPSPAQEMTPGFGYANSPVPYPIDPMRGGLVPGRSDRSRVLGGVLQLIIPGVGRIYLGYSAIGVLQLVLSLCFVGWVWSIIDGIVILANGVRMDGYGRALPD